LLASCTLTEKEKPTHGSERQHPQQGNDPDIERVGDRDTTRSIARPARLVDGRRLGEHAGNPREKRDELMELPET